MRLRREKIISSNASTAIKQPTIHHNKTASMDVNANIKSKNIYLNKILQKNLGNQKVNIDQTNFQKNIPNFQSSIQSILANEETRQKAKNYVLKMRNRQGQNSPFHEPKNLKYKNINFSRTNYDGFYDVKQNKNIEIIKDNSYGNINRDKKEVIFKSKVPYPEFNNYINIREQNTPDKIIRVNKINKYYDEIPTYSPREGNIYFRNNLAIDRNNSRGAFNISNINNLNNNNISMKNNINLHRNANTNYPLTSNNRQKYYKKKTIYR